MKRQQICIRKHLNKTQLIEISAALVSSLEVKIKHLEKYVDLDAINLYCFSFTFDFDAWVFLQVNLARCTRAV